jgi:hypothetical protein
MISVLERLTQLAHEFRYKADAIQTTLAILQEDATATKKGRAKSVLEAALTIETERLNGKHVPKLLTNGSGKAARPPKRKKYSHDGSFLQARRATVDFLERFSTTEPRLPDHPRAHRNGGMSKLVAHGYLKKVGDQYLRTGKVFQVGKDAPRRATTIADTPVTIDERKQAQRLLWKLSFKKPRAFRTKQPGLLAWLVQAGYVKETNGRYLRTGKDFSPSHVSE